jgi:prepilin-type N-terminal cleavage/methylation domain-containing protein
MMRSRGHRRAGLSLIELLISLVVVGIIGASITRLLMTQTRFFSKLSLARDARSVTRQARNLIQTELSMVEVGGGIVAASNDSITVRIPVAWGLYCASGTMMAIPTDSMYLASATIDGYAIKDTTTTGAYTYMAVSAVSNGTAANCTGGSVQITAPTGGVYRNLTPAPTGFTQASPTFLYQTVTYKFAASTMFSGQRGLWRKASTGAYAEIVAPFDTSAKFKYYNLYSDTSQLAIPSPVSNIRGVEVLLDAKAPNVTPGQATMRESSSIKTAIFFRNRTDS